jgi:hypothetical protein
VVKATVPTAANLGFVYRKNISPFKYLLNYPHVAEWTPFQIHCYAENLVVPGIKLGTSGFVAKNSDH